MSEITADALEGSGWQKIKYNNGAVIEYWKTVKPLLEDDSLRHSYSLRVQFYGKRHTERGVMLCVGNCLLSLPHMRTMEEVEALLQLLVG